MTPALLEQIRQELSSAPYGHKGKVEARWSKLLGMDRATLRRKLKQPDGKRREHARRIKGIEAHVLKVWEVKLRPCTVGANAITTGQAVPMAVKEFGLPAEVLDIPVGTLNRVARDLGLGKSSKRRVRFQASHPNSAHHFDASGSKYLYIAKDLGAGEYLLKLHRPGAGGYKNKPLKVDRLRPWYYGLVDDYSGRLSIGLTVAPGESAADSLSFLAGAWSETGLPDRLYADQGMLKKCLASAELVSRLGVELPEMNPYEKESHGKIERPWRTTWQRLETPFFGVSEWRKFSITLTEFKEHIKRYQDEYNAMPHRYERSVSRDDMHKRINLRGGIVSIPENALSTAARRHKRKVRVDGTFSLEGATYEVKTLHDEWVHVYEGVFQDRLVVQCIKTGERHEVRAFAPVPEGEYKGVKKTERDRVEETAAEGGVDRTALPYAEDAIKESAAPNVARLIDRKRVKEAREIESPFDTERFADVEEAFAEFVSITGAAVPEDMRGPLAARFMELGLDRQDVKDLAMDVASRMHSQGPSESFG
jgi:hypothetical protein